MFHQPVLLEESMDFLLMNDGGWYADVTMGGGGHTRKILEKTKRARVIALDQDPDAWKQVPKSERLKLIPTNFRYLEQWLDYLQLGKLNGVIADLGVSSFQIDESVRGFTYRGDAELDMRMDKKKNFNAQILLNEYDIDELQRVLSDYGEVRNARTLAVAIEEARQYGGIQTVSDLLSVLNPLVRGKRYRYLAQVFQAIRIEVNDEMASLTQMLESLPQVMKIGARVVVISYHSLEDRIVKNYFKSGSVDGAKEKDKYGKVIKPFQNVNKSVITPGREEIKRNPRARSAKMRIAEKINNE